MRPSYQWRLIPRVLPVNSNFKCGPSVNRHTISHARRLHPALYNGRPSPASSNSSPSLSLSFLCLKHHNMSSITDRITQFVSPTGKGAALAKNDNDVVIVSAVRTALTKVRPRAAFYPVPLTQTQTMHRTCNRPRRAVSSPHTPKNSSPPSSAHHTPPPFQNPSTPLSSKTF